MATLTRVCRGAVLSIAAIAAMGCQSAPSPNIQHSRGHLIIAGGATEEHNQRVYARFMAPLAADAVIGVISTASASPAESADSAARTLALYAGSRRIERIPLSLQDPTLASNPATIQLISKCSALWFTGGVQSRITAVFRPPSGDTPAYTAAAGVLARGGVIGGTSAGAAMMSDPMITGGSSEEALSGKSRGEGEDSGFGMAQGMGFFPFGLTDQHFLRRGRLGRLIVALERTGIARGYGVEENSAIDVDLASGTITALGPVVLVDVSRMQKNGQSRVGVRVSLLNDGDVVNGRTGIVGLVGDKPVTVGAVPRESRSSGPSDPAPPAWSRGAIATALERVARTGVPVELRSQAHVVRFSSDERTVKWTRGGLLSVHDVLMEIHAAPGSAP